MNAGQKEDIYEDKRDTLDKEPQNKKFKQKERATDKTTLFSSFVPLIFHDTERKSICTMIY